MGRCTASPGLPGLRPRHCPCRCRRHPGRSSSAPPLPRPHTHSRSGHLIHSHCQRHGTAAPYSPGHAGARQRPAGRRRLCGGSSLRRPDWRPRTRPRGVPRAHWGCRVRVPQSLWHHVGGPHAAPLSSKDTGPWLFPSSCPRGFPRTLEERREISFPADPVTPHTPPVTARLGPPVVEGLVHFSPEWCCPQNPSRQWVEGM